MTTHLLDTNATRKNLTLPEITIDLPLLDQGGVRSAVLVSPSFSFETVFLILGKDGRSQHHDRRSIQRAS